MRGTTLADESTASFSAAGAGHYPTQFAETLRSIDRFFNITILEDAPTNNCTAISESLSDDSTLLFITIKHYNRMTL